MSGPTATPARRMPNGRASSRSLGLRRFSSITTYQGIRSPLQRLHRHHPGRTNGKMVGASDATGSFPQKVGSTPSSTCD